MIKSSITYKCKTWPVTVKYQGKITDFLNKICK